MRADTAAVVDRGMHSPHAPKEHGDDDVGARWDGPQAYTAAAPYRRRPAEAAGTACRQSLHAARCAEGGECLGRQPAPGPPIVRRKQGIRNADTLCYRRRGTPRRSLVRLVWRSENHEWRG